MFQLFDVVEHVLAFRLDHRGELRRHHLTLALLVCEQVGGGNRVVAIDTALALRYLG